MNYDDAEIRWAERPMNTCERCGENTQEHVCDECADLLADIRDLGMQVAGYRAEAAWLETKALAATSWAREELQAKADVAWATARIYTAKQGAAKELLRDREEAGEMCEKLQESIAMVQR